jgi:hypothetical protein
VNALGDDRNEDGGAEQFDERGRSQRDFVDGGRPIVAETCAAN